MDQQTMDELLKRVIAASSTWDECKERIKKAYGPEWLTAAEFTARRERYREWFASIDAERPLVVDPEPMPDEEDESDVATTMHVKISKVQLLVPKIEIEIKKPAVLKMQVDGSWITCCSR